MSCGSFANLRSAIETFRAVDGGPGLRYTVENGPSWISSLGRMSPKDGISYGVVVAYILESVLTEANQN